MIVTTATRADLPAIMQLEQAFTRAGWSEQAWADELDADGRLTLVEKDAAGAVRGDFGTTVAGQPVSDELWRRIGVSLRLVIIGSIVI